MAARSVHAENGYFVVNEGYEYVLTLSALAAALAALGPGRHSTDHAFGVMQRISGPRGALLAVGLGAAGAAAQLATFWRKPAKQSS